MKTDFTRKRPSIFMALFPHSTFDPHQQRILALPIRLPIHFHLEKINAVSNRGKPFIVLSIRVGETLLLLNRTLPLSDPDRPKTASRNLIEVRSVPLDKDEPVEIEIRNFADVSQTIRVSLTSK